jgi:transketolase
LDNLTVIIDKNNLQAMDFLENVLTPDSDDRDLERKFEAFGFLVKSCDGHNMPEVTQSLKDFIEQKDPLKRPQVLVAQTIKGYGAKCMENIPKFHFRVPTEAELKEGMEQYGY